MDPYSRDQINHSAAHILAMAVTRLYPDVKIGVGPVTKEGFYYDFEFSTPISWEQTKRIESEMNLIIQEDLPFNQIIVPKDSAFQILLTRGQVYKAELLQEVPDTEISFYKTGEEFIDLCRGPHVRSTGDIGAIKITSLASVHWKGSSDRPKMQRISGVAFKDLDGLRKYLAREEEIQSRDFRNLSREMALSLGGSRSVLYTPRGTRIIQEIVDIILSELQEDSEAVNAPSYKSFKELFQGFSDIFNRKNRSYRELPSKLHTVSRMELNQPLDIMGKEIYSANVIAQRSFLAQTQLHTQLTNSIRAIIQILEKLEIEGEVTVSAASQSHVGLDIVSNQLKRSGISQTQVIDAAMQPHELTVEFKTRDMFDREWELTSVQVHTEGSQFVNRSGDFEPCIVVSEIWVIENVFAFYLEEYEGGLPVWLSPTQAVIIPITEAQNDYSEQLLKTLSDQGVRVELDSRSETMQARIRDAELQKVPTILVVGEKEQSTKTASLRIRNKAEVGLVDEQSLADTIKNLKI